MTKLMSATASFCIDAGQQLRVVIASAVGIAHGERTDALFSGSSEFEIEFSDPRQFARRHS